VGRRSFGVEEEVLLVDPVTGAPRAVSGAALRQADGDSQEVLEAELQRRQLETHTRPCSSLTELDAELRRTRRVAAEAARAVGVEVAAIGTSPLPTRPNPTPGERYQRVVARFGVLSDEQLTCGSHVHVQVDSGEEGVAELDRIRVWLPVLFALSTNSPFWQGQDTGYAGFRSPLWGRWPSAGPTEIFGSHPGYRAAVQAMLDTGTVRDTGMVYFDARLSENVPTVEVRVCDVCLFREDAVLLAALARGLVETAAREWRAGRAPPWTRVDVLRLASWRAARYGVDGELVGPGTGRPAPAPAAILSSSVTTSSSPRRNCSGQRSHSGRRASSPDALSVKIRSTACRGEGVELAVRVLVAGRHPRVADAHDMIVSEKFDSRPRLARFRTRVRTIRVGRVGSAERTSEYDRRWSTPRCRRSAGSELGGLGALECAVHGGAGDVE
jgi:carboxylate-amine ligase